MIIFLNNILRLSADCFICTDICGFHIICAYVLRYAFIKTSQEKYNYIYLYIQLYIYLKVEKRQFYVTVYLESC